MDVATFMPILSQIENFAEEFFDLLDEVDSHKQITVLTIRKYIADR